MSARRPRGEVGDALDGPSTIAFTLDQRTDFATPVHSHARGQLVGCRRGVVTIATDSGTWLIPADHGIWLPPHHPHGGRGFGPVHGWSVYVAPDACASLPATPRIVAIPPLLREAVLRAASWDDEHRDAGRRRIADLIVAEIAHLPPESWNLPLPRDPRLDRIARALLADPADPRSLAQWADWAGITTRTLSRHFPLETGLTFTDWRHRVRMMRAVEMLAEGQSVTATAIDLGYGSVSGFIALFRRTFGTTPAAYSTARSVRSPDHR